MFKVTVIGDDTVGKTTLETYFNPFSKQFKARQLGDKIKEREKKIENYHILKENSKGILKGRIINWLCNRAIKKKKTFQNRLKEQEKLYLKRLKLNGKRIGVSICKKVIKVNGNKFNLLVWILRNFHIGNLNRSFLNGSRVVILIYDITKAKSLKVRSKWVPLLNECCRDVPILLVGNKLDLEEEREVSKKKAIEFKEKYNFTDFMEISLKTGENLEKMFDKSAQLIFDSIQK
jgi:small GTP-binding protein